ncbi:MAG: AMP-binding protein [Streptosporangiales bacterium]|nr:AMP-binding protein [Streptosporangiales bacterium]
MTTPELATATEPFDRATVERIAPDLADGGAAVTRVDTTDPLRALATLYALRAAGRTALVGGDDDLALDHHPGGDGDLAVLTSGSTGRPRAVLRSWTSWSDSFPAFTDLTGIGARDVVLVPGPLSSSLFLFAAVHALGCGADVLATSRWHPATAVSALDRATAVHVTPSMLATLLDRAPASLAGRVVVCAGAGLPATTAARTRAAGARLTHYYGAAELSFVAAGTHEGDLRPFPGVAIDVRADEIWVRSRYVASGYLGAAGQLRTRPGGWASVGDRGRLHPDGRLSVHGRGDRFVLTGGASVAAEEVEAALRTVLPGTEVAVLGLPHPDLGEVVTVVVEDGGAVRPDRARLRDLLDPAHLPRRWLVVDRLPRTANGKVAQARLRDGLRDGSLAARPLR